MIADKLVMTMDSLESLKKIYLFKDFSEAELSLIASICHEKSYASRSFVFNQGERAHSLYVIKSGSVRILQKASNGDWVEVATLGPGSHFGEMPMLDGEARSASAEATESSVLMEFSFDGVSKIMAQSAPVAAKFYQALARFLCGRLRATTNDLSFAKEINIRHF